MMRVFVLLSLLVSSTAFAPQPWGVKTPSQLAMFSADDEASTKTKQVPVAPALEMADAPVEEPAPEGPKSIMKNMNTGEVVEVGWVDPAAGANVKPWEMNWWAYPLVGLPMLLLADDALHFLPTEGPLAFLKTI